MDIIAEVDETLSEYLLNKADLNKIPLMGTFELTPICNMNCEMCYIRQDCKSVEKRGGLKDVDFWNRVLDEAIEEGMFFCLLTGGEIFTYPEFRQLYEKLCRKGVSVVLNTNGTLLTEEIISWLAQFPPRRLNISLYGACNETYEKLCHLKDGYHKVIHAFELLKKYNIDFRVHGVLVPLNIKDYEGIVGICNQFGVKLQLSYYMFPPVRKELENIGAKSRFEPEKMAEIAVKYRRDQCVTEEGWKDFIEKKINLMNHPEQQPIYGATCVTCKAGCSTFWVNWKGEVSGCGVEDTHFYNLEKYTFKEAWNKLTNETRQIVLSEKCAICNYRPICPVCMAAAYCETGRLDGTPEYLCRFSTEYAKLLLEEKEKMRKQS